MKKNLKIIIGAIFLIGGFGCISSDIGAAIFGIVVGIALIAWWITGRKRSSDKWDTVSPTPTVPLGPTPEKQPRSADKKSDQEPADTTSTAPLKPTPTKQPSFPYKKDGAPEAYRYRIAFTSSVSDVVSRAIQDERWYLSAVIESGKVHLFLDGNDLGSLPEHADMMMDWLKHGDPYMAAIEEDKSGSGFVVTLVFYRDKQKYYAHKEQTIVALTGYKSEGKQDAISVLEEGEELATEEDFEKEDRVFIVSRSGDPIGSLPKKYARRVLEEGAALIIFDHEEPIEDSDDVKPYVKIYW